MLVTFLELFLHVRAMYAGVRASAPGIRIWAAQHAGYCSDKVFGVADPSRDLAGMPDGCAMPAPDGIFVMGKLARAMWEHNGFAADRIVITGGLRYQSVRRASGQPRPRADGPVVVLIVASMTEAADRDMCAAAVAAAAGMPSVRLKLRDHPLARFSGQPSFAAFRDRIEVTSGSAEDDLAGTDLILFTHSGFAEEAFVRGIPVWQWLWGGFNTSVFLDVPVVPRFGSARLLREALTAFVLAPEAYRPTPDAQQLVFEQCFGPAPDQASTRIAERIAELLAAEEAAPATPFLGGRR